MAVIYGITTCNELNRSGGGGLLCLPNISGGAMPPCPPIPTPLRVHANLRLEAKKDGEQYY